MSDPSPEGWRPGSGRSPTSPSPSRRGAGWPSSVWACCRGRPLEEVASAGVSLTVAAVPEGLPLLATVAQLSAARRLSSMGVVVRSPRAIEALGRMDVLCADKTGTLTEGRIRVAQVSDGVAAHALHELPDGFRSVLAAALRATPQPKAGRRLPHLTDRALVHAQEETDLDPQERGAGLGGGGGPPLRAGPRAPCRAGQDRGGPSAEREGCARGRVAGLHDVDASHRPIPAT